VILFVVDAESGETPADAEAAELLRTAPAPVHSPACATNPSPAARAARNTPANGAAE